MGELAHLPDVDRRTDVRRRVEYAGSIGRPRGRPHLCAVWDFSEKGVRLVMPSVGDVPDNFVLTIKRNNDQRYHCRIMWRIECQLGVLFMSTIR
jgi:hypothetical protein